MSDDPNTPSGGTPDAASGDSGDKGQDPNNGSGAPDKGDKVAYETYRRTVNEAKNAKARAAAAETELAELRKKEQERKEQQLKDDNRWKEYAEEQEKKAKEAAEQLSTINSQREDAKKTHACLQALDGTVDSEYWHLLDIEKIKSHPESGEYDQDSVKAVIEAFRQKHHRLIDKPGNPGTGDNLPNNAPGTGGSGRITYQEWLKLEPGEMRKRQGDVIPESVK